MRSAGSTKPHATPLLASLHLLPSAVTFVYWFVDCWCTLVIFLLLRLGRGTRALRVRARVWSGRSNTLWSTEATRGLILERADRWMEKVGKVGKAGKAGKLAVSTERGAERGESKEEAKEKAKEEAKEEGYEQVLVVNAGGSLHTSIQFSTRSS